MELLSILQPILASGGAIASYKRSLNELPGRPIKIAAQAGNTQAPLGEAVIKILHHMHDHGFATRNRCDLLGKKRFDIHYPVNLLRTPGEVVFF